MTGPNPASVGSPLAGAYLAYECDSTASKFAAYGCVDAQAGIGISDVYHIFTPHHQPSAASFNAASIGGRYGCHNRSHSRLTGPVNSPASTAFNGAIENSPSPGKT